MPALRCLGCCLFTKPRKYAVNCIFSCICASNLEYSHAGILKYPKNMVFFGNLASILSFSVSRKNNGDFPVRYVKLPEGKMVTVQYVSCGAFLPIKSQVITVLTSSERLL